MVYQIDDGTVKTEFWMVTPTSPTTIAAVRTTLGSGNVTGPGSGSGSGGGPFVSKAGDTMTGPLQLPGAPVSPNQASTKGYVDGGLAAKADVIGGVIPSGQLGGGVANSSVCLHGDSSWAGCGTSSNAVSIQSVPVATTAPSDNQVINLCGLLGTVRAAGRQRSDCWNGCNEIFFGFQLVAVAIHQSGYSRSEDGKFGGVRGRSAGRGATILRLHCRHRNGRSRVSNWRKLQRRRVGRDASIYYRECASFWIHDWQCIERIAGGFDCRAIYADEPDRPIAIRESGCSPGRISGIRAGFDSSFKYHRGFFGIHLRMQDE